MLAISSYDINTKILKFFRSAEALEDPAGVGTSDDTQTPVTASSTGSK